MHVVLFLRIFHLSKLKHLVKKHNSEIYNAENLIDGLVFLEVDNGLQCFDTNTIEIASWPTSQAACIPFCFINTLRLRQDGRRFPDDTFERIDLNENVIILIKISLKFVPYGPINNIPSLVQIMAWRRSGDKPLSEPMMGRLQTHICITRPQRVNPYVVKSQIF